MQKCGLTAMQQYALSFEPVRARKRDPETSKVAASKARDFAANHYNRIAAALRAAPGTYVEIAERAGLERHAVGRRLKEMEPLGVYLTGIKRDGMREWGIK